MKTFDPGLGVLRGMLEVGSPKGWNTGAHPCPIPPVQLGLIPPSASSPEQYGPRHFDMEFEDMSHILP